MKEENDCHESLHQHYSLKTETVWQINTILQDLITQYGYISVFPYTPFHKHFNSLVYNHMHPVFISLVSKGLKGAAMFSAVALNGRIYERSIGSIGSEKEEILQEKSRSLVTIRPQVVANSKVK